MYSIFDPRLKKVIENKLIIPKKTDFFKGTIFEEYEKATESGIKGVIGETIVKEKLIDLGYRPIPRENLEHDFIVNGKKIENKTSVMVENNHILRAKFTHISSINDWDIVICQGASPSGYYFLRYFTKEDLPKLIEAGLLKKEKYGSNEGNLYCARINKKSLKNWYKLTKEVTNKSF